MSEQSSHHRIRRPRVLVVGPLPPPFGGMSRYVQALLGSDLCRSFELSHFNTSFSPRVRSQGVNPGDKRYRGRQTTRRMYGYILSGGGWSGIKTLVAGLLSVPRFALCLLHRRPELVHVFANMNWGFWRAGTMVLLGRLAGSRVVFHPLGAIERFYPSSGRLGRRLITVMLDAADIVLLQSPGLARQVAAFTRTPTLGLFNGIDLAPFAAMAAARARLTTNGGIRFLAVGDLGHNKGTWDILTAAGRVKERIPGASWTFIGRGNLADLAQRARLAGVEDRVSFPGAICDEEKLRLFREADVFLLPSHAEGQPLSILEAMAAGLPIISTPVGSIAEVVGAANGILVPPGDVERLGAAMLKLANDPALRTRMAVANREASVARFDARRLWREVGEIWDRVLQEGRR